MVRRLRLPARLQPARIDEDAAQEESGELRRRLVQAVRVLGEQLRDERRAAASGHGDEARGGGLAVQALVLVVVDDGNDARGGVVLTEPRPEAVVVHKCEVRRGERG